LNSENGTQEILKTKTLQTHFNLKQKIKESKASIRSVRGVGYAITIAD
jgi:DNA-binding response OmpR family regulator